MKRRNFLRAFGIGAGGATVAATAAGAAAAGVAVSRKPEAPVLPDSFGCWVKQMDGANGSALYVAESLQPELPKYEPSPTVEEYTHLGSFESESGDTINNCVMSDGNTLQYTGNAVAWVKVPTIYDALEELTSAIDEKNIETPAHRGTYATIEEVPDPEVIGDTVTVKPLEV